MIFFSINYEILSYSRKWYCVKSFIGPIEDFKDIIKLNFLTDLLLGYNFNKPINITNNITYLNIQGIFNQTIFNIKL